MAIKRNDLIGRRFERLVVIGDSGKRYKNDKKAIYLCKCDCGKETLVYHSSLLQGKTKSCGCLSKELTSERSLKDLTGKRFGRLIVIRLLEERRNGRTAYSCKCDCGNVVVVDGNNLISNSHSTRSCGCYKNEKLTEDVIDGTKARILTMKLPKTNTSGVKGVSWNKRDSKWVAYITFRRKRYYLGSYDTIEEAAKVRKIAEAEMFGEFLKWYNEEFKLKEMASRAVRKS